MLATQYVGKEKDLLHILLYNFHLHINQTDTIVYELKSRAKLFYLEVWSLLPSIGLCTTRCLSGKLFQPWSWPLRLMKNHTSIAGRNLRNNPVIVYTMKWGPKISSDLPRSPGSYCLSWNTSQVPVPPKPVLRWSPTGLWAEKHLYPFKAEGFLYCNAGQSCICGKMI